MLKKTLVASLLGLIVLWVLVRLTAPDLLHSSSFSKAVYARDGRLLRLTLADDEIYRLFVPLPGIAPLLKKAVLLHEDRYFFIHGGVNPVALLRATLETYVFKHRRMGASTITMQVARMRYHLHTKSIPGKIKQILYALQLEFCHSKQAIFEAYLNLAPYGGNIEGVGAASLIYFEKQAKELILPEVLALCVIPQNPNARRPKNQTVNPALLKARKRLYESLPARYANKMEWQQLNAVPLVVSQSRDLPFLAPHFVERILRDQTGAVSVRSTLDLDWQHLLEEKVTSYVNRKKTVGLTNAAVMLLDYESMEILGEVGSADYFNDAISGQVNGTLGLRSPGSTLKPFIYALAMDQGLIYPQLMLKDAPIGYGAYNPENFDNDFQGPISVQDALVLSRNIPAIELANKTTNPDLHAFLKQAGLNHLKEKEFYGLNLVLGGAEVRMHDLLKLYALLANEGKLQAVSSIIEINGRKQDYGYSRRPLLSAESCLVTLDMLGHNKRPGRHYDRAWSRDQLPIYWKTGTSRAFRDAWSVAVFGKYVLAVWVGNFDGQGNPVFVGRDAAGPLLFEIIDGIKATDPHIKPVIQDRIHQSKTLRKVEVCAISGKLVNRHCKHKNETWFIPGKSPIGQCRIHRMIYINERGFRVMKSDDPAIREEVYEFWPSDLLELYRRAGIPRRTPPPFDHDVITHHLAQKGVPPEIIQPRKHVVYSLRVNHADEETIPLKAIIDADVKQVSWFAGDHYIGRAPAGETLFWNPMSGTHILRAVDDHGRVATRKIRVELVR